MEQINFIGTVKESKVAVKKVDGVEIPYTRIVIDLDSYDPRVGAFVSKEVNIEFEGDE